MVHISLAISVIYNCETGSEEWRGKNIIFTRYLIKLPVSTGSMIRVKFSYFYDFVRPSKCILQKQNDQRRSHFKR